MKHIKQFNESWKSSEINGQMRKSLKKKLSLLEKRVKIGEKEGVIVLSSYDGIDFEYFMMNKNGKLEQFVLSNFRIYDELKDKWVPDSNDLDLFPNLTDEEKNFLGLTNDSIILKKID